MLAKIAAFIANAIRSMGSSALSILDWCEQVVKWPFGLVFGHGAPTPHYQPQITPSDVVGHLDQARAAAATVHTLDRDGIETVLSFCGTHRDDRAKTPLPKNLDPAVKVALRTIDDTALRALAAAGIGKVRKFIDGKLHGIPGVPEIANAVPAPHTEVKPSKGMTEHEVILWKLKAQLEQGRLSRPFQFANKP